MRSSDPVDNPIPEPGGSQWFQVVPGTTWVVGFPSGSGGSLSRREGNHLSGTTQRRAEPPNPTPIGNHPRNTPTTTAGRTAS